MLFVGKNVSRLGLIGVSNVGICSNSRNAVDDMWLRSVIYSARAYSSQQVVRLHLSLHYVQSSTCMRNACYSSC
jgi:hypothetical protein